MMRKRLKNNKAGRESPDAYAQLMPANAQLYDRMRYAEARLVSVRRAAMNGEDGTDG